MALIIEDGSIIANAQSYAGVDDMKEYCLLRGIALNKIESEIESLLILAMDYLNSPDRPWLGLRVSSDQVLSWPRNGVLGESGALLSSTEIPNEVFYAQLSLAVEAVNTDLQPSRLPTDDGIVKSEKLDGVGEIVYSNDTPRSFTPAFSKAEALLRPLYKRGGLTLVRV